jgi:anti-anti-sigma factor
VGSRTEDHSATAYVEELRLRVERRATTLVLRLSGDFEWGGVGHVEEALDDAVRILTRHVIFDLREVSFLDVAALTALLRANERSRSESFDVCVVPPRGRARRVFTLTRAGAMLTLADQMPDLPRSPGGTGRSA